MFSTPTVVGDLLYVGSCSGVFYALDRRTGRPRWSHDVRPLGRSTSFHGDPVAIDSMIVIGTDGGFADSAAGEVYAFDLATGRVRWKYTTTDGIISDVCRAAGRLLVITRGDSLICLEASGGRRVWSVRGGEPLEPPVFRSPAVADGRVFFGGSDGTVHALDLGTGRALWKHDLQGRASTGILALGDALYLGAGEGDIYRLRQATGAVEARMGLGASVAGPPAPIGDSLIVFAGDRSLVCVDRSLAAVRWRRDLPERLSSSRPYLRRRELLVGTVRGELLAFRASDGLPRWSRVLGGVIRGIGTDDQVLYVGTQGGLISAYARPAVPVGGR